MYVGPHNSLTERDGDFKLKQFFLKFPDKELTAKKVSFRQQQKNQVNIYSSQASQKTMEMLLFKYFSMKRHIN